MSLLLYLVVLLVSVSSVLFGLGWLAAPEPHYEAVPVQMASHAPATLAPKAKTAGAALSPVYPAAPGKPATGDNPVVAAKPPAAKPAVASTPPVTPAQAVTTAAGTTTGGAAQAQASVPLPACDVQACAAAYRSFRASDCTYQPYEGPRRLCDKGTPPTRSTATEAPPATSAPAVGGQAAQAQASSCNIAACEAAYRSFDSTDCTYQPFNGPRRLCEK